MKEYTLYQLQNSIKGFKKGFIFKITGQSNVFELYDCNIDFFIVRDTILKTKLYFLKSKIRIIQDLQIGQNYYFCFADDIKFCKKAELTDITKDDAGMYELHLKQKTGSNIVYAQEIGIGNTKMEAVNNYGKIK